MNQLTISWSGSLFETNGRISIFSLSHFLPLDLWNSGGRQLIFTLLFCVYFILSKLSFLKQFCSLKEKTPTYPTSTKLLSSSHFGLKDDILATNRSLQLDRSLTIFISDEADNGSH